ncbi:unnamed protein product [Rangifer tarandus platyrhynchus]|uniref:Uncharacterized protein n=1 Tax=Rangifer tarandus platyrhynchus TaxID=3082113 RepID=A0ACB1MJV4_RANTA
MESRIVLCNNWKTLFPRLVAAVCGSRKMHALRHLEAMGSNPGPSWSARGPVPCQGKGLRGDVGAVLFLPSGGSHVTLGNHGRCHTGSPAPSVETSRVTLLAAAGSGPFSEMTRGR